MIDTSTFQYKESRWQDLFVFLKAKGYDVYPPGIKMGDCKAPYIVIKNNGLTEHSGISSNDELYSVMVYVPKQNYSKLEPLVSQVEKDMKEIEPLFLSRNIHTPSYYDDTFKAHMISLEYKCYKRKQTL